MQHLKLEESGLPVLIVFCVAVAIVLVFEVYLYCRSSENQQGYSVDNDKKNGESNHTIRMTNFTELFYATTWVCDKQLISIEIEKNSLFEP